IGPKTKHAYHPDAKREVERRMDSLAARGRERVPRRVSLTTFTLKYNTMNWITIDALGEHWKRATAQATLPSGDDKIVLTTDNVTALTLEFPAGWSPLRRGS